MKKYMLLMLSVALYTHAVDKLAELQNRVQEREAALPEMYKKLDAAAPGSEDARRLRMQIGQFEEFIDSARKEIVARDLAQPMRALPVYEEQNAPALAVEIINEDEMVVTPLPALPSATLPALIEEVNEDVVAQEPKPEIPPAPPLPPVKQPGKVGLPSAQDLAEGKKALRPVEDRGPLPEKPLTPAEELKRKFEEGGVRLRPQQEQAPLKEKPAESSLHEDLMGEIRARGGKPSGAVEKVQEVTQDASAALDQKIAKIKAYIEEQEALKQSVLAIAPDLGDSYDDLIKISRAQLEDLYKKKTNPVAQDRSSIDTSIRETRGLIENVQKHLDNQLEKRSQASTTTFGLGEKIDELIEADKAKLTSLKEQLAELERLRERM